MQQSSDDRFVPMTSIDSGKLKQVKDDIYYYTNQIVNVVFIGKPDNWTLIDAGMPKCGAEIQKVAEEKFGAKTKPSSIILTHGHFDHVGGIVHLIESWNVPVYAHPLEFPYLTGELAYPEQDPTVEGGLLAKISSYYPNEPVNIKPALKVLPADNNVPGLPDWKWIHVPGHAPGQIALFRESDRTLVSGDALITVKQDSLYRVLTQKEALKEGLKKLADHFEELAVPSHGKYVPEEMKK